METIRAAWRCILLVAICGGISATAVVAQDKELAVVVHNNTGDPNSQKALLRNVEHMLEEVPTMRVEVVSHSGGLSLLTESKSGSKEKVAELVKRGVAFVACENTMTREGVKREDLLPGVTTVPSGAVEIVRKQKEGYGYFKP